METPASPASGPSGRPLGNERLSALLSLTGPRAGEGGELFSREVERALERARGEGLQEKRLAELAGARRSERRAGFGGARTGELDEASTLESSPRPEAAPPPSAPALVPAPRPPDALELPARSQLELPAEAPAPESQESAATSSAPTAIEGAPGALQAPAAIRPVVAASHVVPRSAPEAAPVELPAASPTGSERPARAPAAPARAAADAALAERAEEILRQIRLHESPHVQRLALELQPADLGRLSIQLALRTGRLTAIVRAESADTLALLERRADELRAVLDERGLRAESLRFELGFGAARGRALSRAQTATGATRTAAHESTRGLPSRFDTLA